MSVLRLPVAVDDASEKRIDELSVGVRRQDKRVDYVAPQSRELTFDTASMQADKTSTLLYSANSAMRRRTWVVTSGIASYINLHTAL